MKRRIQTYLPWAFALFMLTTVLLSQTETLPTVQWSWNDQRIYERWGNSRTMQFGLRSDGVVVWRELVSVTNSPAESVIPQRRSATTPRIVVSTNAQPPVAPPPLPR